MDEGLEDVVDDGLGGAEGLDDDVAGLVAPLRGLDESPVGEHSAIFEAVHAALREQLAQAAPSPH